MAELMHFTLHAVQHTLNDDERALFAEAACDFAVDLSGDIIVVSAAGFPL